MKTKKEKINEGTKLQAKLSQENEKERERGEKIE